MVSLAAKGNGKGGGLNIASSGAWPSREAAEKQWELWRCSCFLSFVFRYLVCFLFLVEMEDTAQEPRVGVLNYVASRVELRGLRLASNAASVYKSLVS